MSFFKRKHTKNDKEPRIINRMIDTRNSIFEILAKIQEEIKKLHTLKEIFDKEDKKKGE